MNTGCYGFGPFRLDVQKRRLWRDDEIVGITPKAFDTLLFLVRHAGQIVQREDLLRMVWCDTFVADETLAQNISAVRKALGDTFEHPDYIATVPRRGYRFLADVVEAVGPGPPIGSRKPGLDAEAPSDSSSPGRGIADSALSQLAPANKRRQPNRGSFFLASSEP